MGFCFFKEQCIETASSSSLDQTPWCCGAVLGVCGLGGLVCSSPSPLWPDPSLDFVRWCVCSVPKQLVGRCHIVFVKTQHAAWLIPAGAHMFSLSIILCNWINGKNKHQNKYITSYVLVVWSQGTNSSGDLTDVWPGTRFWVLSYLTESF